MIVASMKCPAVWTFIVGHFGVIYTSSVIWSIRGPNWPKERSPGRLAIIGSEPLNRIACVLAPSGRNIYFRLTQGKPWAKLIWPLRATDWKIQTAVALVSRRVARTGSRR